MAELEMLGKDGVKRKGKMEEYDLLWCPIKEVADRRFHADHHASSLPS